MASFELKTKLGYLEVFWDNCWKYMESDIEKVIEIVNERFWLLLHIISIYFINNHFLYYEI